jgi:hypothetical protein
MPERKSSSSAVVFAALAALTVGAAIFSAVVYSRYIAYDRLALEHVPPGAVAVAYIDVEKVTLFDPVRRYLLPLVDELGAAGRFVPRLERIKHRTGLDPALDLREVSFCRGQAASDWVLVLSGKFPKHGLVAGIAVALKEEHRGYRLSAHATTLTASSGWVIGRAADGVLIVASNAAALRAALPERDTWRTLGLDNQHGGSFYLSGAWLASLASAASVRAEPALSALGSLRRVTGSLVLNGRDADVDVSVGLKAGEPAPAAQPRLQSLLQALLRRSRASGREDFAGERVALGRAKLQVQGPSELRTRVRWTHADMVRSAASLAELLRNRLGTR